MKKILHVIIDTPLLFLCSVLQIIFVFMFNRYTDGLDIEEVEKILNFIINNEKNTSVFVLCVLMTVDCLIILLSELCLGYLFFCDGKYRDLLYFIEFVVGLFSLFVFFTVMSRVVEIIIVVSAISFIIVSIAKQQ